LFDKEYRKAKRKCYREEQTKLVDLEMTNPRVFWDYIKKLGPQQDRDISDNVPPNIMEWAKHYENLFKCEDNFVDDGAQLSDSEYDSFLNQTITIDEVNRVTAKTQQRKACGVDNIPNEILKLGRTNEVLLSLFNACFLHHMIPSEWNRIIINQFQNQSKTRKFQRIPEE